MRLFGKGPEQLQLSTLTELGGIKVRDSSLKISGYLLIALVMVLSLAFSPMAEALQMVIWDGTNTGGAVLIEDNGALDSKKTQDGVITYVNQNPLFGFSIVINTGTSKPEIGSSASPKMDLNVTLNGAGTIEILISETGFGPLASNVSGFLSTVGGTIGSSNDTVRVSNYFDTLNPPLFSSTPSIPFTATSGKTGTKIANLGPFNSNPFSGTTGYNGIPGHDPFSLTMVAKITQPTSAMTTFNAYLKPTPEPGTILLLGLGLLGLGLILRRKSQIEG